MGGPPGTVTKFVATPTTVSAMDVPQKRKRPLDGGFRGRLECFLSVEPDVHDHATRGNAGVIGESYCSTDTVINARREGDRPWQRHHESRACGVTGAHEFVVR